MLLYALVAIAGVIVLFLLFLVGRAAVRALRAFVKSCWPQS
jgi:hypothetical protein